ncbi:TonB-dependent receptor [Porticoccaceae bacterium]|nr:TonB-dependent receptor [Porticoccaceae bacterium]
MKKNRLSLLGIFAALIAADVSAKEESSRGIDEILVTATKRTQNLQDISVSMTALSGDKLDAFGFEDTRDIFSQIPNVSSSEGSFSADITIRGNSTLNPTLAGEDNVALYFDEVYRPAAFYGGGVLMDVERAEVLRGPQGTLFGRNSTAGLVHFISRKPTEEQEGYLNFEYGSYGTNIVETAISGPISDQVRGRLALKYHEDDGFQDNQGPAGGKLGVTDRIMGRAHLDIDINDDMNLLLSLEASDADDIGKAFNYWGLMDPAIFDPDYGFYEVCDAKRVLASQCVGGAGFSDPNPDVTKPYTEHDPSAGDGRYTLETETVIAKLTWQLNDDMELVSISALDSLDRYFNADEDGTAVGMFGLYQYNDTYTVDADQFSQEIHLSGGDEGRNWLVGLFYLDDDRSSTSGVAGYEWGVDENPDTMANVDTKSYALFGEINRSLSDTLSMLAGFRYTDEEKKVQLTTQGLPGADRLTSENLSGKLGLEWRPRDEMMIYASLSTGFRSGNFNSDLLFGDLSAMTSVDPEEVTAFELGSKSTLMDGRLQLNAALFYQEVSDKQGITYDSNVVAPVSRLISLGDADIYGVELELLAVPTDNLELSLGIGWVDTEISADPGYIIYSADNAARTLDGSELGSPDLMVNGVASYNIPLNDGAVVTLQTDFSHNSEGIGTGGNEYNYSEAKTLVNARVFWVSASEKWEVQAYVKNVFDTEYIDNTYGIAGSDYVYGNMGMPRWAGIKVGMNF